MEVVQRTGSSIWAETTPLQVAHKRRIQSPNPLPRKEFRIVCGLVNRLVFNAIYKGVGLHIPMTEFHDFHQIAVGVFHSKKTFVAVVLAFG